MFWVNSDAVYGIAIPPGKDRWRNATPMYVLVYHGPVSKSPPDLGLAPSTFTRVYLLYILDHLVVLESG